MTRQAARIGLSVSVASALVYVWEHVGFGVGAVVTAGVLLVLDIAIEEKVWHRWIK